MITITGFADEISPDLEVQMSVLESEGLSHIELRGVYGKNVLKLTDDELAKVKGLLDSRGFKISSIGSPIGKYGIRDDFSAEIANITRASEIANYLNAPYIRIFSYFIPEGEEAGKYREEVLSRMKQLIEVADKYQVTLLLENESKVYGDIDDRCLDLLASCNSPRLRLAFDPGNFVMNGVKPVSEALPKLVSFLEYVHVKDASIEKSMFVPAGDGDGEFVSFIKHLKESNFSGYLSIEPHLQKYLPEKDGPGQYVHAVRALKKLLNAEEMAWN
ncbi:sugar phosphate isomerase/epimerase family protein [Paenibacillus aceris]|uniref:Sugar phosphate isomerase/epimerase n=1 Tax=Paenibacillus aceris TaxID=869555 RepID=A0ABS4I2E7_9BACL|nr:sugar phosphate isomerase/epimerase family protein [Paenibacillus aceris]MBP1964329.1 sugar phosphate isomerase/epimerase [Paenibacillus aceris]NHW36648.1 sugar phosphate isomerase/epimerase [Paenibacillus aceris]